MSRFDTIDVRLLYVEHGDWLRSWLRRHIGISHRAADLAQDAFCRILTQPELRLEQHPRRYLATIARRLVIDETRRDRAERSFLEAWNLLVGQHYDPSAAEMAEAIEELAAIARLLDELPTKPRRAFLLHRLDGLKYREIAAEMGVSTSMVKQYVARAHAHCYAAAWLAT